MMRSLSTAALAVQLLFVFSAPGEASDATPADRATVAQCLKEKAAAGEDRVKCVGVIADPCLDKSEDSSTFGMATCSWREHAVWDERLNAAYRKLMADLDRKQRASLRDMQRNWISFHEKKCSLHDVLEEGSSVIPVKAYCYMGEVGRQAVFLEVFFDEGDSR